jgi:hypothetical protein
MSYGQTGKQENSVNSLRMAYPLFQKDGVLVFLGQRHHGVVHDDDEMAQLPSDVSDHLG